MTTAEGGSRATDAQVRRHRVHASARIAGWLPIACGFLLLSVLVRELAGEWPRSLEGYAAVGAWLALSAGWIGIGTYVSIEAIDIDADSVTVVHAFGLRRSYPRAVMRFRRLPDDRVQAYMPSASWIRRTLRGFRVKLDHLQDPQGFQRAVGLR